MSLQANQVLRAAAFQRVERSYLIGLRAQRPETRAKFFALYDGSVPRRLFDRLKYIILEQDWERLSHTFWLKQAMVRFVWFGRPIKFQTHFPSCTGLSARAGHGAVLALF